MEGYGERKKGIVFSEEKVVIGTMIFLQRELSLDLKLGKIKWKRGKRRVDERRLRSWSSGMGNNEKRRYLLKRKRKSNKERGGVKRKELIYRD